ncbi:MAG: hypothetical protein GF355_09600 [Candidatus Eisenbacteria bacterium]|nr:hypothetical protein [Candidatus Eisenbacteria bacterium]
MPGETMISQDFPREFRDRLPFLDAVLFTEYDEVPSARQQVLNMESTTDPKVQKSMIGDMGLLETFDDDESWPTDRYDETYYKTFTVVQYGTSVKIGQVAMEDDKWSVFGERARLMGQVAQITQEIHAASIFNNGFDAVNFPIPDGQALCDGAHPLDGGATDSNLGAADVDVGPLQAAITAFKQQRSHRGHFIGAVPVMVLIPVELEWMLIELLQSKLRPDVAENATNALRQAQLDWGSWHYLTDPDAWFLLGPKKRTKLYWITRLPVTTSDDRDPATGAFWYKLRTRYSYGALDWRNVWGSPGA